MICIVGCIVGDFDPGVISISVPVTRYSPFERAKRSCGTSMLLFLQQESSLHNTTFVTTDLIYVSTASFVGIQVKNETSKDTNQHRFAGLVGKVNRVF